MARPTPQQRAILRRLAETAERTGDDWGMITSIDGYLEDDDNDDSPVKFLLGTDQGIEWNLGHVGEGDEDNESAKRAHKNLAAAIRELREQDGSAAKEKADVEAIMAKARIYKGRLVVDDD